MFLNYMYFFINVFKYDKNKKKFYYDCMCRDKWFYYKFFLFNISK